MSVAAARWCLRAQLPPDRRSTILPLEQDTLVIGRQPGLDLTLSSPYVSERHAELTVFADRLYVTDLDSRNGTYVNGKRVRRAQLGIGDVLLMGDVAVRLDRDLDADERQDSRSAADSELLSEQLRRLLAEKPVSIVLQPIVRLADGMRVGYRPLLQSTIAGLESEDRILAVARRLGSEGEVHARLLKWRATAAPRIDEQAFLYVAAPRGINIELELEPFLNELRAHAPAARIWIGVENLHAYSLPALNRLTTAVERLKMELICQHFVREQLRFLQSTALRPAAVHLDSALVPQIRANRPGVRLQLKALCDQLHHYGIQVCLDGVGTADELKTANDLGVDLAAGSVFGDPLRLERIPRTDILTPEQLASLLEESPPDSLIGLAS